MLFLPPTWTNLSSAAFLFFLFFSVGQAASLTLAALPPITPVGETRTSDSFTDPLVQGCPQFCHTVGHDPANWTHIHDLEDLVSCDKPLLFDLNIHNDLSQRPTVRTCVATTGNLPSGRERILKTPVHWSDVNNQDLQAVEQSIASSATCGASVKQVKSDLVISPTGVLTATADGAAAAKILASYVSNAACGTKLVFAKSGDAMVALYSGPGVQTSSVAELANEFSKQVQRGAQVLQTCNKDDQTVGFFATDAVDQLSDALKAIQQWASGSCITVDRAQSTQKVDLGVLVAAKGDRPAILEDLRRSLFERRAECRVIQVASGDSCGSLASRCGVSGAAFTKYNPKKNFCSTLMPKQYVCCSAGAMPDMTPQPQKDGTCAVHTVVANDNCPDIASNHGITVKRINDLNKATWGWAGCDQLQPNQKICLSKGNTPMPSSIEEVACGPQKPGTKRPAGHFDGFDLAKLNPCPLKACCSGWGFCGTTAEFCTKSPAKTGAPGAMKKGTSGCISNCGTEIVGNDKPPAEFRRVKYFEAFNGNRRCLNMDVKEIPATDSSITHVHFAFAGITEDFQVTFQDGVKEQFNEFTKMKASWKKIISFGGWAESTEAGTFQRYKNAVKPANRDAFANAVIAFVRKHNLDGVDFDWEYPGATDIPGVPGGSPREASDYLEFLKIVKSRIGDKSLSIALPASYWYLKPFPVDKMAKYLDYFIYMTYDLHGQWDFNNKFVNPGCKGGNCLRSHVNKTETENALSMITKAGVPSNKICVGVSSFARSFGMKDPSCTGPNCKFTGSFTESTAEPGDCTNTGGYISNAELDDISFNYEKGIAGYEVKKWYDHDSDSDIMVYGTEGKITTWAAYMSNDTKADRTKWIEGLNFGGTTDWAIDLDSWHHGSSGGTNDTNTFDNLPDMTCHAKSWPDNLEDLEAKVDSIPENCRAQAVVGILSDQLENATALYQEATKGFDDKFKYYAEWIRDSIDDSLEFFMQRNGTKYMDCEYSSKANSGSGPCTEMNTGLGHLPALEQGTIYITYTMRDEDGFYKALLADYGIEKDWVRWVDKHQYTYPCGCPGGAPTNCPHCRSPAGFQYKNYPRKIKDNSKIEVKNPKKIIEEAIPNMEELAKVTFDTYTYMAFGALDADDTDVAVSISMPVFMLEDAATEMEKIKEIGETLKKDEQKTLIMNILTGVLAVIPFAGEAALAVGGATALARGALIIGEASNIALSIVDVVDNPASAPFAILNVIGSAAGIRAMGTRKAFSNGAEARYALSEDQIKLFGKEFQRKDALVQSIVRGCAK